MFNILFEIIDGIYITIALLIKIKPRTSVTFLNHRISGEIRYEVEEYPVLCEDVLPWECYMYNTKMSIPTCKHHLI